MLPLRVPRLWLTIGWLLVVAAFYVSLAPSSSPIIRSFFIFSDKFEHAFGYFALTTWFTGLYPRSRYWGVAVALFLMGVAVELLQGWMAQGRDRDMFDVAANTGGIAAGWVGARLFLGGWAIRIEALFSPRER